MAEPKIKTVQARFGFADPDLKKPLHDEMVKWIELNIQDILMHVFSSSVRPKKVTTRWEQLVRMNEDRGQFIGFVDLVAKDASQEQPILIEAKTEITSLGELFRQLRLYRAGYVGEHYVGDLPFVIVCPDETNAKIIREQNFYFLKYNPWMNFAMGGI